MSLPREADVMEPEKNLHAAVPPGLLRKAQAAAQRERISLDELVSDAMERRLNRREFEEVLAFGKRHAKARGLKPSDLEGAITGVRADTNIRDKRRRGAILSCGRLRSQALFRMALPPCSRAGF